jgi:hypothetical protein
MPVANHLVRALGLVVALAVWVPATAFFMLIGLLVGRDAIAGHGGLHSPIEDARAALITTAYSLGGAVVGLGLAWLVLPRDSARGLKWLALLWIVTTAFLLAAGRVSGGPLLGAAIVASGVGVDVIRRLVMALFGVRRSAGGSL